MISRGEARRKRIRGQKTIHDLAQVCDVHPTAYHSLQSAVDRYLRSWVVRASMICERFNEPMAQWMIDSARQIDLFVPTVDAVRWRPKQKRSGGYRNICAFSLRDKVRHWLIKDVVEAVMGRPACHYGISGFGASALVTDLARAIDGGRPHVLTADIKSAFASVDIDGIYSFHLIPPDVLRYALDYRHLHIVVNNGAYSRGPSTSTSSPSYSAVGL